MTKADVNSNPSKSTGQVILEYILLAVCLCVIALRSTLTESPMASAALPVELDTCIYGLGISAVLIFSFGIWLIWCFCGKRFVYRFTGLETGLFIFAVAAIIAGLVAPDKRAAITNAVIFLAPIIMAVLLVQILDSSAKIRLLLAVIAALGAVSAYSCADQFFTSNEQLIEFYQQNPDEVLAKQGIAPGSIQHWQFEHRVYSKDVRGFFTTSNSAGSFAMLASFAAVGLFLDRIRNLKSDPSKRLRVFTAGFVVAFVVFGLAVTGSKGSITASVIAAAMFAIYFLAGNWLKIHKKGILVICLLLVAAGGCAVVWYGLSHGRLPGGHSMFVRWQYWFASARMYADHPFTGVGPGNFASFYPNYKIPAALETVADPHNFLLSLLTQYGPIGLIGFLTMIFVPLYRPIFCRTALLTSKSAQPQLTFKTEVLLLLIVISAALLFIRPILAPMPPCNSAEEKTAAAIMLYVIPVIVFIIAFLLLTVALYKSRATSHESRVTIPVAAALFCAVVGCLIHNLIDFAIFEPGVLTTFWAIVAAFIAAATLRNCNQQFAVKPTAFTRIAVMAAGVLITWAYFKYCLIPVAKSTTEIKQAYQANRNGNSEEAYSLLAAAVKQDHLSPVISSLAGRLYLQNFYNSSLKNKELLLRSEQYFLNAIHRNTANFRNFELLSEVYTSLAELSKGQAKTDWLNKTFNSSSMAVERYPGSAKLRIRLARIAEQLGKIDLAVQQYKKTIEVEDSFRLQFRIVYPDRKIVSRLGEEEYNFAKQRIKLLCP